VVNLGTKGRCLLVVVNCTVLKLELQEYIEYLKMQQGEDIIDSKCRYNTYTKSQKTDATITYSFSNYCYGTLNGSFFREVS